MEINQPHPHLDSHLSVHHLMSQNKNQAAHRATGIIREASKRLKFRKSDLETGQNWIKTNLHVINTTYSYTDTY